MSRWEKIKDVVVVGLGITGLSVVNYLRKHQPHVSIRLIDTREAPPGTEALSSDIPHCFGEWQPSWLIESDLIVVNPGIALSTPELQPAINKGIPVVGDIELFAWHVDKPVVAITGSNGKSTVTDLLGKLIQSCGFSVGVGGNIGTPALDLIDSDPQWYVLELSSFQLETTSSLELRCAVYLNLSEDHMDRYDGMAGYNAAKQRIFRHASHAVVNGDDKATFPHNTLPLTTFAISQQADFWLDSTTNTLMHGQEVLFTASQLKLVGRHNIANVLTCLAVLDCCQLEYMQAQETLFNYVGLAHRCQLVHESRGVRWVNDSKATNVASTEAALSGLDIEGTLYLLVGGVGKGADFTPLAPVLATLPVKLCCFGRDGDQFMPLHASARRFDSIQNVVDSIVPELNEGDVVMLSPACASFDQFKGFTHRGDVFSAIAQQAM